LIATLVFVGAGSARADLESVELVRAFPALDFDSPMFLTAPPDGTDRIVVIERPGTIRIFPNDPEVVSSKLFLDIGSDEVDSSSGTGEKGLLGLAFDPSYASNGYFYVDYTSDNCASGSLCTKIVRYTVSEQDADLANPESAQLILEIRQPASNHNGGMLAFGPADGMLYIAMGDGGGGGDTYQNGQNKNTLLGAILRIDPHSEQSDYDIPDGNPFVDVDGADEIWLWGLRNPWRFSFDRQAPHDLWIGDVGQNAWEEVDWLTAADKGANLGWNVCEGAHGYGSGNNDLCDDDSDGYEPPVLEYANSSWEYVTGGYVYRGSRAPALRGYYVYAKVQGPNNVLAWDLVTVNGSTGIGVPASIGNLDTVTSFGEDEAGELYALELDGAVYSVPEASRALLAFAVLPLLAALRRQL